jgi:anti-sigma B factor antagonist
MAHGTVHTEVRNLGDSAAVVDISGDVTSASEQALMDAFTTAASNGTSTVVLNFTELEYMNSGGIGMLVTLLVRANRQGQRMLAYGLNDHYRQIFELTRLDEAIAIHNSESDIFATLGVG